jgi:hypothetical protein
MKTLAVVLAIALTSQALADDKPISLSDVTRTIWRTRNAWDKEKKTDNAFRLNRVREQWEKVYKKMAGKSIQGKVYVSVVNDQDNKGKVHISVSTVDPFDFNSLGTGLYIDCIADNADEPIPSLVKGQAVIVRGKWIGNIPKDLTSILNPGTWTIQHATFKIPSRFERPEKKKGAT